MTTKDLDRAQKIVSKARKLTMDINILERTNSCKVILVLSDGHNFSLYNSDRNTTSDLIKQLHQLVITALADERATLQQEFEEL